MRLHLLTAVVATFAALCAAPAQADPPVVVYPQNYPGRQLCQIDRSGRWHGFCGAHSYHPYGTHGYRPYGTYRPYREGRSMQVAPNARIIHVAPTED